jgi:hypothetical protein
MLALLLLAVAPVQFQFDASEFTNAVYHVACLAGQSPCSNSLYTEFWNERYKVTREDGAQFDAWKGVFQRAERNGSSPAAMPIPPNLLSHYPSLRIRQDLMAAVLGSPSPRDLERRAAKIVPPADAAILARAAAHIQERLHPWWMAHGKALVDSHRDQVQRYMAKEKAGDLMTGVAAFFGGVGDMKEVYVHLVASPRQDQKNAKANFMANHFVVEVLPGDDPRDTAWKAVHELTHAMYERTAPKHSELIAQFLATKERAAQAMYTILNEAVATAVQLILVERQGRTDDDPYHHPFIPRMARTVVPLLKEAMTEKRTFLDGFVPKYVSNAKTELGPVAATPPFLLLCTAVLGDEDYAKAFHALFPALSTVTEESEWRRFPEMNAVRMQTYAQSGDAGASIAGLAELKRQKAFAYIVPRGRTGMEVYLLGQDAAATKAVVEAFAKLPSIPASGLAVALD